MKTRKFSCCVMTHASFLYIHFLSCGIWILPNQPPSLYHPTWVFPPTRSQYFGLSRQSITSESAKLLPDRWNTKIQVMCLWWVSFQAFVAEGCDPLEVSIHRKTTHILYNTLILVVPINPQGHPKSWHFGWMEWHTHSHQCTTWLFHIAYDRCLCVCCHSCVSELLVWRLT